VPDAVDDAVELTDARAIRAIAHPARMLVINRLYDDGRPLTATQAAELAGTTASAMSYHLRALERFGIVRRSEAGDGRERPWVRAAKDLRIRPSAPGSSRAVASATGAVLSMAMDVSKQRLLDSVERATSDRRAKLPLDAVTSFGSWALVVTPDEAKDALRRISEVLEPFSAEVRADPPEGAGRLALFIATAPDSDLHITPADTTPKRS
jgi:DNA-binding transcriptional ArsR family regulator